MTHADLICALDQAFPTPPRALGIAVSGGGDSMALLHAACRWDKAQLCAVTVDHGLRPQAAEEARLVAQVCAGLGLQHTTLRWQGWDGTGNLQDRARRARYALIADWARGAGLADVALGHTADDLAETFLMRLSRAAGLDGLAAMRDRFDLDEIAFHRPFLELGRADLRGWLSAQGLRWVDDPSNDDPRFDRARMRAALAALDPLGLTPAMIAASARHLAEAREVMDALTRTRAEAFAHLSGGDVVFDRAALAAEPAELRRRLLEAALRWVASADYPPRAEALARAAEAALRGEPATLHGCLLLPQAGGLRIAREWKAVEGTETASDALWDGRWRLHGPHGPDLVIRALGEKGLAACPDWRATGLPRASLLASPAVWRGDVPISAPIAGKPAGWRAELRRGTSNPFVNLISH